MLDAVSIAPASWSQSTCCSEEGRSDCCSCVTLLPEVMVARMRVPNSPVLGNNRLPPPSFPYVNSRRAESCHISHKHGIKRQPCAAAVPRQTKRYDERMSSRCQTPILCQSPIPDRWRLQSIDRRARPKAMDRSLPGATSRPKAAGASQHSCKSRLDTKEDVRFLS